MSGFGVALSLTAIASIAAFVLWYGPSNLVTVLSNRDAAVEGATSYQDHAATWTLSPKEQAAAN